MAYVVIKSGEQVGTAAGDTSSNSGGLKLEWQLRYYTSTETVTIMGKTYTCGVNTYRLYYKLHAWFGMTIGANIRIGNRINSSSGAYIRIRNDTTNLWSATMQSYDYANRNPYFGPNSPKNTWYPVSDASSSDYKIYPEGLISLTAGATIKLNLDYYVGMHYNTSNRGNAHATSSSATFTVSGGVISNTLTVNAGTGTTVVVNRQSSPLGGASTGIITSGATVYYNDTLKVTFTANTGYTLVTHTIQGVTRDSGYVYTVKENPVSIIATAVEEGLSFAEKLIAVIYKDNNYSLYIPLIFDGTTWKKYIPYRYIETE